MYSSCNGENDGNAAATLGGDDHDQDLADIAMPPAHDQLLADERPSFETLKDRDHAHALCPEELARGGDQLSWCRRQLSAATLRGGGSWLLGTFARLAAEAWDPLWAPPGLARVPSGASLASDEDASAASSDTPPGAHRGVSFAPLVTVQPIPHASALSSLQRGRMYTTSAEVRRNKLRNKKEFRHEGWEWRATAEEWQMGVDMTTGELVHPAHEHGA